ncbi:MAG: hypothetical protein H2174_03695 [Vampirovibrio sp.]|nr:hypothetical protein [Vampirovibrio sp.]
MMPFPFIAAGVAVGIGTVAGAVGGTAYLVTQDGEGKIQKSPEEHYEIPDPSLGQGFECINNEGNLNEGYLNAGYLNAVYLTKESKFYEKTYTCKYINPKLASSKEEDEAKPTTDSTATKKNSKPPDPTFPVKQQYNPYSQKVTTTVYATNGSITDYRSDRRNSGYIEVSKQKIGGGSTPWQPIGGKATPKPNLGKGVKLTEVKNPNAPLGEKVYTFDGGTGTITTIRTSEDLVKHRVVAKNGTTTTYTNNLKTGAVWANTGNATFQVTLSKKEKQQQQEAMNKLKKDGKEFAKNSIATGKRLLKKTTQIISSLLPDKPAKQKAVNLKKVKQNTANQTKEVLNTASKPSNSQKPKGTQKT